jgi:hypothetical protein
MRSRRILNVAVAVAATFASLTTVAHASVIPHCPTGWTWVPGGEGCTTKPPIVHLNLAQQTPDRSHVHIAGSAVEAPFPPLTVQISIDGVVRWSGTTDAQGHYDVTVPAALNAQQAAVTRPTRGPGRTPRQVSRSLLTGLTLP